MLYLIGIGLNLNSISKEGLDSLKECNKIYLESYTVDFPYKLKDLESSLNIKIIQLNRSDVESNKLIHESKDKNIALLIYGSPLFATTHLTLINDAKKNKIKTKIIFSASVFDAISLTGLQLYKFGKIASMPKWQKNFTPYSFLDLIEENRKINAHSLLLIDIGFNSLDALNQFSQALQNKNIKPMQIIVCSMLGTSNQKIFYGDIENLKKKKIKSPYCFIIPGPLHFTEEEYLKNFKIKSRNI